LIVSSERGDVLSRITITEKAAGISIVEEEEEEDITEYAYYIGRFGHQIFSWRLKKGVLIGWIQK